MVANTEIPGFANQGDVVAGAIGFDLPEQGIKTLVKI
jgi:hypothetical protein